MPQENQRGSALIFVMFGAFWLLSMGALAFYLTRINTAKFSPLAAVSSPQPVKTQSSNSVASADQNPFDSTSDYQNPFDQADNPFNTLQ